MEGATIATGEQKGVSQRRAVSGSAGAALTIGTTAPRAGKPAPYDDHLDEGDDWIA